MAKNKSALWIHTYTYFKLSFFLLIVNTCSCVEKSMNAVILKSFGPPSVIATGKVFRPALRQREVLVKVKYSAVNRADTLQRAGKYPAPKGESEILGLEACGEIVELGVNVTKWKTGAKVMGLLSGGGYAEYVAVHESHLMPLPYGITFEQSAAIPEVFLTAYQLLYLVAKFNIGETVLIHAGASGVGTAAIQLVKQGGGIVICTASNTEKLEITSKYGADLSINYKSEDFHEKVKAFTSNKGVDIILDCVGGSYWKNNIASLAMDGRWINYGLLGGGNISGDILRQMLSKRASLLSSTLRSRSTDYKEYLVSEFMQHAYPLFQTGKLQPVVDSVVNIQDTAKAHERMENNLNIGKIILKVEGGFAMHDQHDL